MRNQNHTIFRTSFPQHRAAIHSSGLCSTTIIRQPAEYDIPPQEQAEISVVGDVPTHKTHKCGALCAFALVRSTSPYTRVAATKKNNNNALSPSRDMVKTLALRVAAAGGRAAAVAVPCFPSRPTPDRQSSTAAVSKCHKRKQACRVCVRLARVGQKQNYGKTRGGERSRCERAPRPGSTATGHPFPRQRPDPLNPNLANASLLV